MSWIVSMIIGFMIGVFIARFIFKDELIGSLRVDRSDPESGPYLFLEINPGGMKTIYKKKQVRLNITLEDYISQE